MNLLKRALRGLCACLTALFLFCGCSRAVAVGTGSEPSSDGGASVAEAVLRGALPNESRDDSSREVYDSEEWTNLPSGETALVTADTPDKASLLNNAWTHYRKAAPPDEGILFYAFWFGLDGTNSLRWDIGYFESEGVNAFEGTYVVDGGGVFTAMLTDEHKNASANLSFAVEYLPDTVYKNGAKNHLIITVLSCDNEKFSDLIGLRLGYDNQPDLHEIIRRAGF